MKKMHIVKAIVFLAAFLLFQIELIMAKVLLPKFGGGYSVWGAAVVFFQAMLLLGYAYSHVVIKKLGVSRYRYVHLALMALTLLFFPGRGMPAMRIWPNLSMVINIPWQLLWTIGACFFFLSTTSIIFQSWLASSELREKKNPYILYGISNLGSFAALLTYPVFFEAIFDLNAQLNIWRISYFILAALHIVVFKIVKIETPVELSVEKESAPRAAVSYKNSLRWFLLGAAGAIMFLSITNIITYEIIPMPLLWILPLSIYLLSFALNFKNNPWNPPWIREKFHIVLAVSTVIYFLMESSTVDFAIMLVAYLGILFAVCMACQGELYRTKPEDNRNLTLFYLIVSLGSFLGGIAVSWVIPLIFSSPIEYLAGLLAVSLAWALDQPRPLYHKRDKRFIIWLLVLLLVWPFVFRGYNVFGIIIIIWAFIAVYSKFRTKPFMISLSLIVVACFAATPVAGFLWSRQPAIHVQRNYYGIYKVRQQQEKRYLSNGNTMHGGQYTIKQRETEPLAYYHYSTPMGRVLLAPMFAFDHIGMIGLGTGAVCAYGRQAQTIDIFELDPDVYKIATRYFTYIKNCQARTKFIFGDARITLRSAPEDYYNILIIDAFSADYIPVHLLTVEAMREYKEHMAKGGIILFHISNRYLVLRPVLFANAQAAGAYACGARNQSSLDAASSEWVAVTWDRDVFDTLTSKLKWRASSKEELRRIRPWTDLYTNVMGVLRFEYLINQIRTFQPFYWDPNILRPRMKQSYYYAAQGGRSLLESDYKRAIDYYQRGLELNPDDIDMLNSLGMAYYSSGQYQQAINTYKKAVDIDPENPDIFGRLAAAYTRAGSNEEAIAAYKKAIDIGSKNPDTLLGLAGLYNSMGKAQEAADYYKKAVELNPNAYDIALAYRAQQDILSGEQALKLNPNDFDTMMKLGDAYYFLKQYKQAAGYYQKIADADPNRTDILEKLGDLYCLRRDYQKGMTYFQKALEVNPADTARMFGKIGRAYAMLKDFTQALDYYNKALVLTPDDPVIYLSAADTYIALKQVNKFRENIVKARDIFVGKKDEKSVKELNDILKKLDKTGVK